MFTEAQKLRISLLEVTTLYQQKSKFFIYVNSINWITIVFGRKRELTDSYIL